MSEIDFVITWLDDDDPEWRADFEKFKQSSSLEEQSGVVRYKNLETLKYLFRGIERNAPWVRKVHLVTYGHIPSWINISHPKINLIKHTDIFPDASYLPTFSSGAIEMCLDNIPGLSNKFVYFNDDTFLLKPVKQSRFFTNDLPNDFFIVIPLFHDGLFSHSMHEQMTLINKIWNNKSLINNNILFKVFNFNYGIKYLLLNAIFLLYGQLPLFKLYHQAQPFLRQNIIDLKAAFPIEVDKTMRSKFREYDTLSQYIFRFWSLVNGKFQPFFPKDDYYIGFSSYTELKQSLSQLCKRTDIRFVCLNDTGSFSPDDYTIIKAEIHHFFDSLFPDKSSFES